MSEDNKLYSFAPTSHNKSGYYYEKNYNIWLRSNTHLPQCEDVFKRKLPLEPDEQPAETETKRAAVL